MPIKDSSVGDLPRTERVEGRPPSKKPIVVNVVAQAWYDDYLASGKADYAPAIPTLPYRLSLTGFRCDRQLYYFMQDDLEPSNPITLADAWRFELGHYVGDGVAAHMGALGEGWFAEWNVDLRPVGIQGSGHVDAVQLYCKVCGVESPMIAEPSFDHPRYDHLTSLGDPVDVDGNPLLRCADCWLEAGGEFGVQHTVEVKSINGFGFKKAVTSFSGPPEGAKDGHVLQGAIAAAALGCDRVIVAYFSVENLSPQLAPSYASDDAEWARFAGEWHFSVEKLRPAIDAEVARVQRLLALPPGTLPSRELHDKEYPPGAVVVAPATKNARWQIEAVNGVIVNTGTTWMCGYCSFRDQCISDGAGGVPEVEL